MEQELFKLESNDSLRFKFNAGKVVRAAADCWVLIAWLAILVDPLLKLHFLNNIFIIITEKQSKYIIV